MKQSAETTQVRRIALRRRPAQICGIVVMMLGIAIPSAAQEAAVPPQVMEKSGEIEYVGPDTYILLDSEGRPQLVPGMTYEDFLAAWKQSQQPSGARNERRYSLERIDIEGEAAEGHARLKFTARVHLLTDSAVEVPLGLVGAILHGAPQFERTGDADGESNAAAAKSEPGRSPPQEYLYSNPEHGGYVVHLEGRAGERRDISLDLIVPLVRDGTDTTLPLDCPRALSSTIVLALDKPVANAIVNSGTLVASESSTDGGTRLKVAGAMGSVRLTWQAGDPAAGEVASVLGAEGTIRVSIDGRSVRSDARLTVQSYGGSFDRFRVRLPPGAQLVRDEPTSVDAPGPEYRITVVDESLGRTGDGEAAGQIVLVQLPEKQHGRAIIELSTEQPIGLEDGGPVVELGGFEVLGAVRQFGDIVVAIAEDWQGRWNIGDYVRQVDPSALDESLQQADSTAAFQYDRQPWSLGVTISPRQFRVHVAPHYELEILPDEALLTVHLAYQVFGPPAFEFRVDLAGWEMAEDAIDSGGVVDQDRIQVTPDDTLVLPLAQNSSRRADITLAVRRVLPRDLDRVRLPLPIPLGDAVGAGELVVTGAADIELLPDLDASLGLTATPVTTVTGGTNGGDGTTHRFRTSLPKTVFVAERLHRTREVTVAAAAQIEMHEIGARIDQRYGYAVRYEPIKELHFEIPRELSFDPEQTEIALLASAAPDESDVGEREIPLTFVSTETERARLAAGIGQLSVALPQPRLGQFAIRIRYQAQLAEGNGNDRTFRVPLLQPTDGRIASQTAAIRTPRTLAAALDTAATGSSWKTVDARSDPILDDAVDQFDHYVAGRAESALPLLLRSVDPNLPSSTIVERVWLQTWLSGEMRQDRAAFRFRTTASQTAIELPPQVPPDEVEVLVDGQPADLLSRGAGRILVRPPVEEGKGASELHTLELRYRQSAPRGLIRRHRLTPPQIVGTTMLSEVYWQIVLPGDRHIVRSPDRMACASQWQWLGSFWGRRAVLRQADLEKWSGAAVQLAPVAADNEYLFTGLAPVSTIEVWSAPRWLIVLSASSTVLIMVLIWIYTRRAQRVWIIVGLAVVIAGLAIAYPATALLLAQASALGVVLGAISVFIAHLGARRTRWPVTLSSGSSQRQLTPRGDSKLMPPLAAAASTAPTGPLAIPDRER